MITKEKSTYKRLNLVLETQWMFNQYLLLMVLARGVLTLAPTFTRAGYEAMPHLFVILKLSVPLTPFLPIHKEILLSPLGSDLLWHHQNTHKVLVTFTFLTLPVGFHLCQRHSLTAVGTSTKAARAVLFWTLSSLLKLQTVPPGLSPLKRIPSFTKSWDPSKWEFSHPRLLHLHS